MLHNQRGQSLVEVIVAATVGILVVSALTFATIFSLRNANFSKTSAQATKLAQEGIERVRSGRDRNVLITNFQIDGNNITSWNGSSSNVCLGSPDVKSDSIWCYQINGNCGTLTPPTYCYFNINVSGELQHLTVANSIPSLAESIGQFKRVVILSDDSSWGTQKIVTVIVTWTDATGPHESKLTTILRKI